jgi:ATP synthase protein I
MDNNDLQNKLGNLDERIKNARKESTDHGNIEKPIENKDNPEAIKSARAGSEFLASVIAGGFLGFGIDWLFSTKPWAMILFMVLGFVSGVLRANNAMKKNNKMK